MRSKPAERANTWRSISSWSSGGSQRVLRGGSWDDGPIILRSAFRDRYTPDYRSNYIGFRIARTL
ncbi:MAG: SUMF1/EgtB/PvdO family nonheme iron enzyme [Rhodoferax sp.]|nr:SUMF1/EgtB/PvdO family nonheme iron enzyme [Rhodoferax sp.]